MPMLSASNMPCMFIFHTCVLSAIKTEIKILPVQLCTHKSETGICGMIKSTVNLIIQSAFCIGNVPGMGGSPHWYKPCGGGG